MITRSIVPLGPDQVSVCRCPSLASAARADVVASDRWPCSAGGRDPEHGVDTTLAAPKRRGMASSATRTLVPVPRGSDLGRR